MVVEVVCPGLAAAGGLSVPGTVKPKTVSATVVVSGARLPDVPVIVTVAVPVVAELLAVSVSTLVEVAGFVPNAAVTPLGRPDAASITLPVKPFVGTTVIVLVPLAPCAMLKLVGLAESVKFGGGVTVRLIVVVSGVKLPDVPVTVTVDIPAEAEPLAVSVKMLVPVVGFVPNAAVTPLGSPEAASVTLPVKPFVGFTVIVLVPPAAPGVMVTLLGAADSVKFGGGVTVRLMVAVCVRLPDFPVTVTVAGPVVAVAEAVSVSVEFTIPFAGGVTGFGENAAVTPLGRPVALSVVAELKPFWLVTVIVLVPMAPCAMLKLVGFADSVKFGAAVTVRAIVVVAIRLPDVPVMVTVVGPPTAAEALAVSVSTLVEVVGFVANAAVTPLGRPDAASVTLPVKPPTSVTVIVLVPMLPCTMLKLVGLAESVKLDGAVTVRLIVVVAIKLPDVPVTVTVAVPMAAELLAVSVSTLVVVVGFGANAAVTPLGRPEAASVTLPVKPFAGVTVIVLVPLLPCATVKLLGAAESVKLAAAATTTCTELLVVTA